MASSEIGAAVKKEPAQPQLHQCGRSEDDGVDMNAETGALGELQPPPGRAPLLKLMYPASTPLKIRDKLPVHHQYFSRDQSLLIGRGVDAHVLLNDERVSKKLARVEMSLDSSPRPRWFLTCVSKKKMMAIRTHGRITFLKYGENAELHNGSEVNCEVVTFVVYIEDGDDRNTQGFEISVSPSFLLRVDAPPRSFSGESSGYMSDTDSSDSSDDDISHPPLAISGPSSTQEHAHQEAGGDDVGDNYGELQDMVLSDGAGLSDFAATTAHARFVDVCNSSSSGSGMDSGGDPPQPTSSVPLPLESRQPQRKVMREIVGAVNEPSSTDDFPAEDDGNADEPCCSVCSSADSSLSDTSPSEASDVSCEDDVSADKTRQITDTQSAERHTIPAPLVAKAWQESAVFSEKVGSLSLRDSDVVLDVTAAAIKDGDVEVHAAVCADVRRIRHVLRLSEQEQVVSPLAEFWVSEDFRFRRAVTVTLPHCLPPQYDPDRVTVYHVTRDQQGALSVTCLTRQAEQSTDHVRRAAFRHSEHTEMPEEGSEAEMTSVAATVQQQQGHQQEKEQKELQQQQQQQQQHQEQASNEADDGASSFAISPSGVVTISTDRFCAYVCVYCDASVKKHPELYITATVPDCSVECIHISAHVWDARLKVKDFRKLYKIDPGDNIKRLDLLEAMDRSKLYLRLLLSESSGLSHIRAQQGGLLVPEAKAYDIPKLLSCKKCIRSGKLHPISNDWLLQPRDGDVRSRDLRFTINANHVAANLTPCWQDADHREQMTSLVVSVKVPERGTSHTRQWTEQLQALSTTQLIDMADRLHIPAVIASARSQADFGQQLIAALVEEGPGRFIPVLASLMSQMSLNQNGGLPGAAGREDNTSQTAYGAARNGTDPDEGSSSGGTYDGTRPNVYYGTHNGASGSTVLNIANLSDGGSDGSSCASNDFQSEAGFPEVPRSSLQNPPPWQRTSSHAGARDPSCFNPVSDILSKHTIMGQSTSSTWRSPVPSTEKTPMSLRDPCNMRREARQAVQDEALGMLDTAPPLSRDTLSTSSLSTLPSSLSTSTGRRAQNGSDSESC